MQSTWLVTNPASAGSNDALVADVLARLSAGGRPVNRIIDLGAGDALPDEADALAGRVGMIVTLTGDGTLSALADRLGAWPGTLLVLPGGTMNLLARALHADRSIADICDSAIGGDAAALQMPMLAGPGVRAYAGILAGPTAIWREVREAMRERDLTGLATQVPRALSATLAPAAMGLDGHEGRWTALYLQPGEQGIRLLGIRAEGMADLAAHGLAWARGDFRAGPHDDLGEMPRAFIHGPQGEELELLVDGEPARATSPAAIVPRRSLVRFLAARGRPRWD